MNFNRSIPVVDLASIGRNMSDDKEEIVGLR